MLRHVKPITEKQLLQIFSHMWKLEKNDLKVELLGIGKVEKG